MKTIINIVIIIIIGVSIGVLIVNHQQKKELSKENAKIIDDTIKAIIEYTYGNSLEYYFQKIDKNSKVKLVNSNEYEVILNNKSKSYQLFEDKHKGKYFLFGSKKVFLENIKKEYEKKIEEERERKTEEIERFKTFLSTIKLRVNPSDNEVVTIDLPESNLTFKEKKMVEEKINKIITDYFDKKEIIKPDIKIDENKK